MPSGQSITIPFGTADPEKALAVAEGGGRQNNVAVIDIDRNSGDHTPLRLHHGPYDFRATPGLGTASDTETRLTLIHDHLHALCDLWQKAQHSFVDAYFDFIASMLEREQKVLTERLAAYGGLYHYRDWAFSALRPLPRAHIRADDGAFIAVDFAFWTGSALVTVDLTGFQTPTKSRRAQLAALADSGATIIDVDSACLAKEGTAYIESLLPAPFHCFWEGEVLPQSPFKPDIVNADAPDGLRF